MCTHLSGPRDEHQAPCVTSITRSTDGVHWEKPRVAFPAFRLPDGSETIAVAHEEVAGYLSGASGTPMLTHSFVALDGDRPVSAILVSRYENLPLIAYLMTAASHKGRGLATGLTAVALSSLHAAGEDRAHLWVTAGNEPAERIYARLGFSEATRDAG